MWEGKSESKLTEAAGVNISALPDGKTAWEAKDVLMSEANNATFAVSFKPQNNVQPEIIITEDTQDSPAVGAKTSLRTSLVYKHKSLNALSPDSAKSTSPQANADMLKPKSLNALGEVPSGSNPMISDASDIIQHSHVDVKPSQSDLAALTGDVEKAHTHKRQVAPFKIKQSEGKLEALKAEVKENDDGDFDKYLIYTKAVKKPTFLQILKQGRVLIRFIELALTIGGFIGLGYNNFKYPHRTSINFTCNI
jgi:hypothetical protein